MSMRVRWTHRLGLALLWLAATAAVAFLVARAAADDDTGVDVTAPIPPIATDQRATVTLAERTIAPVVSGDGSVMRDPDHDRWLLVAPAATADVAYRLLDPPTGVKALIDGGPAGFDCAWAGLGQPDGSDAAPAATPVGEAMEAFLPAAAGEGPSDPGGAATGGVTIRCAIPDDVRVVTGLTGTMVLQLAPPTEALALPVSAVVGSEGQGQVVVVHDDGTTEVHAVEIGAADTFWVEITGGLEPGERVLEFPTQFDFGPGSR
jgi:hypothetical protein